MMSRIVHVGCALAITAGLAGCGSASEGEESSSLSEALKGGVGHVDGAAEPEWTKHVLSNDHWVDHVSTVSANYGENVKLSVRERVTQSTLDKAERGRNQAQVVLFVHGASVPSVPDFDLRYGDFNWMAYLAHDGFDVFAMDVTGFGLSPRPKMDDPCNAPASQQSTIIPRPLPARCAASYPHVLTTSQTENDEITTVVEYLRRERKVDKISLVGWSQGGQRVAAYAARNPDKVESMYLYAALYSRTAPSGPPSVWPMPGTPMTLQTRSDLYNLRWDPFVKCPDQLVPGVRDALWSTIMEQDPIGSTWGPADGTMRVRTFASFGWNKEFAQKITFPTFIIVGQFDGNAVGDAQLYEDLPAEKKMLVNVDCASHFFLWEKQHNLLHWTSREWLKKNAIAGVSSGVYRANSDGVIEGLGGPDAD